MRRGSTLVVAVATAALLGLAFCCGHRPRWHVGPRSSTGTAVGPQHSSMAAWQSACCAHKRLRQLHMPGTHDAGTYRWTLPQLPMLVDEVAALLYNVISDLSRTQTLPVYE